MPVARYRGVEDMPSAFQGGAAMTPAEGLRLACELSDTALRLSRSGPPPTRVLRRRTRTEVGDVEPRRTRPGGAG
jgi:hypothetical protein